MYGKCAQVMTSSNVICKWSYSPSINTVNLPVHDSQIRPLMAFMTLFTIPMLLKYNQIRHQGRWPQYMYSFNHISFLSALVDKWCKMSWYIFCFEEFSRAVAKISRVVVHPCEKVMGLFLQNISFIFFCSLSCFSYVTYDRWSIWIMLILIGFRSLATSRWHFERGN